MKSKIDYNIDLSFSNVSVPPFKDILVISHFCPNGKLGMTKCYESVSPEDFEIFDVVDEFAKFIVVNKKLLKKIDIKDIISVLQKNVFPFLGEGETFRVDFKIEMCLKNIKI